MKISDIMNDRICDDILDIFEQAEKSAKIAGNYIKRDCKKTA